MLSDYIYDKLYVIEVEAKGCYPPMLRDFLEAGA